MEQKLRLLAYVEGTFGSVYGCTHHEEDFLKDICLEDEVLYGNEPYYYEGEDSDSER